MPSLKMCAIFRTLSLSEMSSAVQGINRGGCCKTLRYATAPLSVKMVEHFEDFQIFYLPQNGEFFKSQKGNKFIFSKNSPRNPSKKCRAAPLKNTIDHIPKSKCAQFSRRYLFCYFSSF